MMMMTTMDISSPSSVENNVLLSDNYHENENTNVAQIQRSLEKEVSNEKVELDAVSTTTVCLEISNEASNTPHSNLGHSGSTGNARQNSSRRRARSKHQQDSNKWINSDLNNGYIRVFNPEKLSMSQLIACSEDTSAHKICLQIGIPSTALHVQYGGDRLRRLEAHEAPLGLQCQYLRHLGYVEQRRIQKLGTSIELAYLIRFFSGRPFQDFNFRRNSIYGNIEVRKRKLVQKWMRRFCVISGTRLIIYKGNDTSSRPSVIYLTRRSVTGTSFKNREFCIRISGANNKERSVYLCLRHESDYQRWLKQLTKATNQLPNNVDFSHCHLETIPESIFHCRDLKNLNLRHNSLQRRPPGGDGLKLLGWLDDLAKFRQLTILNLANNDLLDFPLSLCDIGTLQELNVSSNKLTSLPDTICKLNRLETLHVHNNQLTTLPWEMSSLTRLAVLVLAFNHFETVPEALTNMTDFNNSLFMSGNKIAHFTENQAAQLKDLKRIDLRFNELGLKADVALHLQSFEKLTHLDVRDNDIEEFDLRCLLMLQFVSCDRNRLQRLQLSGCALRTLLATHNKLTSLEIQPKPEWLETLDVSWNKLSRLPENLAQCYFLQKLFVSHNELIELPSGLFSEPGSQLKIVRANHNFLTCLPNEILCIPFEELYLQSNRLATLPDKFLQEANKLRLLNVSKNSLQQLPPLNAMSDRNKVQELFLSFNFLNENTLWLVSGYQRLKVLHIAHNGLKNLPGEPFLQMELLRELNISGNRLKSLPVELGHLPNLNILRVHSNAIRKLPDLMSTPALRVLDLGCNQLLSSSIKNLMDGRLSLLDVSCNKHINMSMQDLNSLQNRRKVCLIDMTGENRIMSNNSIDEKKDLGCDSTSQFLPRAPITPPKLCNLPFMAGLAETCGNRNKLCISVVKKMAWPTPDSAVFAMFDGGYNNAVPRQLREIFPRVLVEEHRSCRDDKSLLKYSLLACHRKLRSTGQRLGASAAAIYLKRIVGGGNVFEERWQLTVANVGDVQAILSQNGEPIRLTRLFRVSEDLDEARRVCTSGGIITDDSKVNGTTTCSRLLGISHLYPQIIPDPQITQMLLTKADDCIVLATKTFWNHVGYEEALAEVRLINHPVVAAKRLMDLAQAYGSAENISVLVIKCRFGQPISWWNIEPVGGEYSQEIVSDDDESDGGDENLFNGVSMHSSDSDRSQEESERIERNVGYSLMAQRSELEARPPRSVNGSAAQGRRFLKKHEVAALDSKMRSRISFELKSRELDSALSSALQYRIGDAFTLGSMEPLPEEDSEQGSNWMAIRKTFAPGRKVDHYLGQTHRSLQSERGVIQIRDSTDSLDTIGSGNSDALDRIGDASFDPPNSNYSSQISIDPTYARIEQNFLKPSKSETSRIMKEKQLQLASEIANEPLYSVIHKRPSHHAYETQEVETDLESEWSSVCRSQLDLQHPIPNKTAAKITNETLINGTDEDTPL